MTSLLRRATICVGLAACGVSALSEAQSTSTVLPERPIELRRAPLPVAAAPIVQQSPNGLYKLSITDTGIELLGPRGVIKITDAGIEIGATQIPTSVAIKARDMDVKIDQAVRLEAGSAMNIKAGSSVEITGSTTVSIVGANMASLIAPQVKLGCSNGKAVARAGDQVNTTGSPAVILQGLTTVSAC